MDEIFDIYNQQIGQSKSSIFTKEDVLKLFSEFYSNLAKRVPKAQPKESEINAEQFDRFQANIITRLSVIIADSCDIVDYTSAEFTLGYDNKVELESVEIYTDVITDFVNDILLDEFETSFGKVQE